MENKIVVFQNKRIRRTFRKGKWFFSVVDVVGVLAESSIPKRYWSDLKMRLEEEGFEAYDKIVRLKLKAEDGRMRLTDCADTEAMFRIIQAIPSPKAEPFKRWLAKVGYERVQEIEDPELAQRRMKELYRQKGYSEEWIEKRMRGIAVREELTDEWRKRGLREHKDFSILTAEISKATFGLTPAEHKELKGIKRQNLRDHMEDMELILTMLGEATTSKLTQSRDSKGFAELESDAKDGGEVAGSTRKNIEKKLGKSVVSANNFLRQPEKLRRLEKKTGGKARNRKQKEQSGC